MKKLAVVLFNLGGPDSLEAVQPFLINLFSDPAIIRLPKLLRLIVARLIAAKRHDVASDIYAQIGGRSPIVENTEIQARALEKRLADLGSVKCFVSMRYWAPYAADVAKAVKEYGPDNIILLPLYPQFSTTTTASSLNSWKQAAPLVALHVPMKTICCYPDEPGFIAALARMTRGAYEKAEAHGKPRLLFSAHGLPEKIIKDGDPYRFQCERTAAALVNELNIPGLDHVLCYQSRVGPLKWIGPSTDDEIKRAGRSKVPVLVAPIAFSCENSETLYEIDILYRELAATAGVPYFERVPAVGTEPEFIEGLAALVRKSLGNPYACLSSKSGRLCPQEFSGCINKAA